MPLPLRTRGRHAALAGLTLASLSSLAQAAPATDTTTAPVTTLRKTTVTATQPETTTEGSGSYTSGALTVGSKQPRSIRHTPQSVSVVTEQRIREQRLNTLDNVLMQTPGISVQNESITSSGFFARGFLVQTGQIDGVPMTLGTNNYGYASPDIAFYDHVEVLRGSAGLLNGAGDPGATINLVRKRPTATPQILGTLEVGRWQHKRGTIDASGVLSDNTRVRGVALYEDREYFYDVAESQKAAFYGILEHDFTERTTVSVGGLIQQFDTVPMDPTALPRYTDGGSLHLPRSTFLGASWNRSNVRTEQWFIDAQHAFNDDWRLKASAFGQDGATDYKMAYLLGAIDRQTGAGAMQRAEAIDGQDDQHGVDIHLSGAFNAFGRRHDVLVGANWADRANYYDSIRLFDPPYTPVDIFNYDPHAVPNVATPASTNPFQEDTEQRGLYATTTLRPSDALQIIVGGRWSKWEYARTNKASGALMSEYDDQAFMPYGGIVYDVNATWSLFASYAEIFQVQNAFNFAGERLDPIIGGTYEAGVKAEFGAGLANLALSVFHTTRENASQRDPVHSGPTDCNGSYCFIAEGKQESQGVEVEFNGQITPRWNLFAAYTYNTTEYVRDRTPTGTPSDNQGKPIASWTPEHMFRAWTSYVLPVADDRLSIGAGVNAQSKFYRILNAGTVNMNQPNYTLVNARIAYEVNPRLSLALNANNLLDKSYYARMNLVNQGSVYGEPRNVVLSLQGRFL